MAICNYRLILEYDGTNFFGYQKQLKSRTIQGELEKALKKLFRSDVITIGAGRTDAGVHALGQVVNFKVDSKIPFKKMGFCINRLLPDDIAVTNIDIVSDSFNSRYDALMKRYTYMVYNCTSLKRSLFLRNRMSIVTAPLDLEKMRKGAEILLGKHDFTSFCKKRSELEKPVNPVRTLDQILIRKRGRIVFFDLYARSFLRNMVRAITGTLIQVGGGILKPEDIEEILKCRDSNLVPWVAGPSGLYLMKVEYDEDLVILRGKHDEDLQSQDKRHFTRLVCC